MPAKKSGVGSAADTSMNGRRPTGGIAPVRSNRKMCPKCGTAFLRPYMNDPMSCYKCGYEDYEGWNRQPYQQTA